ncbi:MAG TPA: hypothetical protein VK614_09910 [Allosphingosinicella sp.]|nr:hypothetical protein [Allosphingosinicella sp.]
MALAARLLCSSHVHPLRISAGRASLRSIAFRPMMFAKRLREGVREGRITCSVRIWNRPHVKPGGVYRMGDGHIIVESIRSIALGDITGELARRSGFKGVVDLLKVAKHGSGTNVYLIEFQYLPPPDQGDG